MSSAAEESGGPPYARWTYNHITTVYVKTWHAQYIDHRKYFDKEANRLRSVQWTCNGVEPVWGVHGNLCYQESWEWAFTD